MAGHSRWANIRHKKAKSDAKRGKLWSKCVRAVMVAARNGAPDPGLNLTLRIAVDEAKAANVPKDTIERAIKKAAGEMTGQAYEAVRYEGYGPGGVAVIVDALTDNRTRTAAEMRLIFGNHGGNMGSTGSVAFQFEHCGQILVPASAASEERLLEIVIDAGASDVSLQDEFWSITTPPAGLIAVREVVERAGITVESAALTMLPTTLAQADAATAAAVLEMIEELEDNDDVQKVYTNLDGPEE